MDRKDFFALSFVPWNICSFGLECLDSLEVYFWRTLTYFSTPSADVKIFLELLVWAWGDVGKLIFYTALLAPKIFPWDAGP